MARERAGGRERERGRERGRGGGREGGIEREGEGEGDLKTGIHCHRCARVRHQRLPAPLSPPLPPPPSPPSPRGDTAPTATTAPTLTAAAATRSAAAASYRHASAVQCGGAAAACAAIGEQQGVSARIPGSWSPGGGPASLRAVEPCRVCGAAPPPRLPSGARVRPLPVERGGDGSEGGFELCWASGPGAVGPWRAGRERGAGGWADAHGGRPCASMCRRVCVRNA